MGSSKKFVNVNEDTFNLLKDISATLDKPISDIIDNALLCWLTVEAAIAKEQIKRNLDDFMKGLFDELKESDDGEKKS